MKRFSIFLTVFFIIASMTFASIALCADAGGFIKRAPAYLGPRLIDTIIIHRTSGFPNSGWPYNNTDTSAESIVHKFLAWHSQKGFHYVIRRDGTIEQARPYNVSIMQKFNERIPVDQIILEHTIGKNKTSLAVAMAGHDEFTGQQIESLEILINYLVIKYPTIGNIETHPLFLKDLAKIGYLLTKN